MTTATAEAYADEFAARVWKRHDHGAPFGLIHDETEEWTDDEEAYASYLDDEETPYREADAHDLLSGALDFQYLVNGDRTYRAARILVGFGGPNVWIDTRAGVVEVAWWSAPVTRDLPNSFIDGLDDVLSDLWEAGA